MPKLDSKTKKAVDKADSNVGGGFEPLEPGKYVCALKEVEAAVSQAGNSMWKVQVEDLVDLDGNDQPGRQFDNLMLPGPMPADYKRNPKSRHKTDEDAWESYQELVKGRLKQFFEAFGYTTDSDTDEMIGDRCVVTLSVETISQGNRKGQLTNRITKYETLDSVDFEDTGSNSADDDDF